MRKLSKFILWLSGWKIVGTPPSEKKYIMIAAPHTSNWDFIYARAAFYIMGIRLRYTVKSELFFFPLGAVLKSMGGIAINRKAKGNMVDKMVQLYENWDSLTIMITPEGTRSYSPNWKKGFYHIAVGANIPISLGFLNYEKKEAGIGPLIYPTGDYEADLEVIQSFYRKIPGRFPEKGVI